MKSPGIRDHEDAKIREVRVRAIMDVWRIRVWNALLLTRGEVQSREFWRACVLLCTLGSPLMRRCEKVRNMSKEECDKAGVTYGCKFGCTSVVHFVVCNPNTGTKGLPFLHKLQTSVSDIGGMEKS